MINAQLNTLFEDWEKAMLRNGDKGFCYDGLINRNGQEDAQWQSARRRILFLLKEQNDNDGKMCANGLEVLTVFLQMAIFSTDYLLGFMD